MSMKVGERGQVTIPKSIREQVGIEPNSEVEFSVARGTIVLRKQAPKLNLRNWRGACHSSFDELRCKTVDEYIEDVRGR